MRWKTLLLVLCLSSVATQAQTFDRLVRPMVTLSDRETIDLILNELLILSPDSLTSVLMVDVTDNGWGVDDLIVLNPTGQVHHLDMHIPPALQELMTTWSFEAGYREEGLQVETGNALLAAHISQDAAGAIAGSCVDALSIHYGGDNMNLLLSQGQGTVQVEMWGFDKDALRYGGAGGGAQCEINRQRFEFAPPLTVTAFREGSRCLEVWGENGRVVERPCGE